MGKPMRVGLDLHAIQAPSCRGRGIGRYAKSLLRAVLAEAPSWEFVFYRYDDLELDWDPDLDARVGQWVTLPRDPVGRPDGTFQRVVQRNAEGLDWLVILNPLVERRGFAIPEPVPGGPRLAAVVYDLIPALFPRHYLADSRLAAEYDRDLRRLSAYDLLLAISESTGHDVREWLGFPAHRIANIRAAIDRAFFRPAGAGDEAVVDEQALRDCGVRGPFFYYLGNVDWRKNVLGLVDAFALLPDDVRAGHQLVLGCQENAWFLGHLRRRIERHGLEGRVVLTGPVTDEAARALYRNADLFLFPSRYEGFGLPILEAMGCGAAVVAADNSSQPEVVGTAGVLARTDDPADWAATIAALVRDPGRRAALRRAALAQVGRFSWEDSARRLREAVEAAPRRWPGRRGRSIALVPYPSRDEAGFDARAAALFVHLCAAWEPVVFSEPDRAAALPPRPMGVSWYDKRLLGRVRPVLGDPPVLYLVDTLDDLGPLIDDLEAHPGVVAFCNPRIADWPDLAGGSGVDRGLRRVLGRATAVVCHSAWLHRELARMAGPGAAGRVYRVAAADDDAGCREARVATAEHYAALLRESRPLGHPADPARSPSFLRAG
jgi:glycosyltransferase involved in cell wall biosynthesis